MKSKWFRKALAALLLAALLATMAVAEEPAANEWGEMDLLDPRVYAGEAAGQAESLTKVEGLTPAEDEVVADALSLAAKKVTLGVKETFSLAPSGDYTGKLTFTSSDASVAKVNSKGKITAKGVGKATVRALLNGKSKAKCVVTVKSAPTSLALNKSTMSLKAGMSLKLKAKLPSGTASKKIKWSSSKKSVATVDANGVVTGKKAGKTKITAKTYNGMKATCVVTVKGSLPTPTATPTPEPTATPEPTTGPVTGDPTAKPTATPTAAPTDDPTRAGVLSVSESSVTVKSGETYALTVTLDCAYGDVYWSTSDADIASCDGDGYWNGNETGLIITGVSPGKATLTIANSETDDALKIDVTVVGDVLSVSPASLSLAAGETRPVVITFTRDGSVRWQSSDKGVATCEWGSSWEGDDATLYVTGCAEGTATLTITNTATDDTATVEVVVSGGDAWEGRDDSVKYRALLIGEESFKPVCTRNRGDVTLMKKMLASVNGPAGGEWYVTERYDLNASGVKSAIKAAFADADEDDVSLFFIATHGDVDSSGASAGALAMVPSGFLKLGDLAKALKAVPGKVIVVIESCGSGAGVYTSSSEQNAASNAANSAGKSAAKAFDNAVVNAFSGADDGIAVMAAGDTSVKNGPVANTGELRVENKFYVLAASRYQEYSWGTERGPYNYFTKWLTDGIGTSGSMPADEMGDGNRTATLDEVFSYISTVGDNHSFYSGGDYYYQHVQVYPKNCDYGLFRR